MSNEEPDLPEIPDSIMFSVARGVDLHPDAVVARALQLEMAQIDESYGIGKKNLEQMFELLGRNLAAFGKHLDMLRPRLLEHEGTWLRGDDGDPNFWVHIKELAQSMAGVVRAIYALELVALNQDEGRRGP